MLTKLYNKLTTLPAIRNIAQHLTSLAQDTTQPNQHHMLRVAPLLTAARIPVVAAITSTLFQDALKNKHSIQNGKVVLFIVETGEEANRAVEDLGLWLGSDYVMRYPASDTLSYEAVAPDMQMVNHRMQVIQRLTLLRQSAKVEPPLVIVAPIKGLMQPTLSIEEVAEATYTLRVGDTISQNSVLSRWIAAGYRMVSLVEGIGEMARRGGIVDIWYSGSSLPIRIEWFGDEIDSLRRFDPQSQRSDQRLEGVTIGPPLEIPFQHREDVLEQLLDLNTSGLRKEVQEEWEQSLSRMESGGRFEGWLSLVPFLREYSIQPNGQDIAPKGEQATPSYPSLLDHLPPQSIIALSEAESLARFARDWHEQAEEQRTLMLQSGELLAAYPRTYLRWQELWKNTASTSHTLIDLSNNELPITFEQDEQDKPTPILPSWEDSDGKKDSPQRHEDTETEQEKSSEEDSTCPNRVWEHTDLPIIPAPVFTATALFSGQVRRFVHTMLDYAKEGEHIFIVSPQAARFQEMLDEMLEEDDSAISERITLIHGVLSAGWCLPEQQMMLYTDTEIFGIRRQQPRSNKKRMQTRTTDDRMAFLQGLKPGEYVVHIEHGIAIYEGMVRREVGGIEREYLSLRFAANDRLYIPVDQIDRVARYVGAGDAQPRLTRLGTQEWEQAKRKAREAVQDMANELLELYAQRKLRSGFAFTTDNEWQHELETSFPYVETNDQIRALTDVKNDMETSSPMDRLICGDVGFGKTEVAIRAAFKAVQDSKQVAILVPTTVLAQQHYETFNQRMAPYPVKVEMLSRFRSTRQQNDILQRLGRGEIDIVVGTHRLLSKDVFFKDLGLLIIDEEQRFGVRHKERLKQMRTEVDVLTLTATPIPRTLHMALAGVRDMSVIETPPEDRIPIKTYVVANSKNIIRDAIRREMDRGGQVYFVHNRVHSIYHIAERIQRLVPEASIGIGHGQLEERHLEKVMLDFYHGVYDVLVCTTIIESGLDVPSVNTIIIDDAPMYGLAQLYQLRGRVGRSSRRAYAYLLYRRNQYMSKEAMQRLQAIQEATELGAGFRIAMRDLEIRGAGNMLGKEQSGHIAAVGFDLYSRLLEQAIKQLRTKGARQAQVQEARESQPDQQEPHSSTISAATQAMAEKKLMDESILVDEKVLVSPLVTLTLPLPAYLPEEYIRDDTVRLNLYHRMIAVQKADHVQSLRRELRDRFGELPTPALHLLTLLHVKILALQAHVSSITATDDDIMVRMPNGKEIEERLKRRFGQDRKVRIGKQFIRLERSKRERAWIERLLGVLEVLAGEPSDQE